MTLNFGSRRSTFFSVRFAADSHVTPSVDVRIRMAPSPPTCASASRNVHHQRSCQRTKSVKALCEPASQIFLTSRISALVAAETAVEPSQVITGITIAQAIHRRRDRALFDEVQIEGNEFIKWREHEWQ